MNLFKTMLLMTLMTALFIAVGSAWGRAGMTTAFVLACVLNLGSYWFSDKVVLMMYRAQEVRASEAPELVGMVRELTEQARLPMPRVYVIPADSPNAFATGRSPRHAAVAVTEGARRLLDRRELRAVIAHELAHVRHYDILIGAIVAAIAGAIMLLATMMRWAALFGGFGRRDNEGANPIALLALAILAPIAATLIQLAISRSREYAADRAGARLSGDPLALASALRRLDAASRARPLPAGPETAHMFIVNPLRARSLAALFSTHPPVAERIARLEAMARE